MLSIMAKQSQGSSNPMEDFERTISELVIESSKDGILAVDHDLRYTLWNPQMETFSGMKKNQVLGTLIYETFPFLADVPPFIAADNW